MTCSTNLSLVEHVERAIFGDCQGFSYKPEARAAIRATLEWLGENVSAEMIERSLGWREYDIPDHWPDEARFPYGMFRAMLSQAMKEMEGGE